MFNHTVNESGNDGHCFVALKPDFNNYITMQEAVVELRRYDDDSPITNLIPKAFLSLLIWGHTADNKIISSYRFI